MIRVGLTGSIGSGKTTVLSMLENAGFLTINLDDLSKSLLKKNTREYKKTVDFFGKNILNKEKEIDRKKLAETIFSDNSKKTTLENIIYPALRSKVEEILASNSTASVAIIEGAVIFESGYNRYVDKIILVICDLAKRLERSCKRFNYDDFIKRDKYQLDQSYKIAESDFIINNSYGYNFLIPQIHLLINFLNTTY